MLAGLPHSLNSFHLHHVTLSHRTRQTDQHDERLRPVPRALAAPDRVRSPLVRLAADVLISLPILLDPVATRARRAHLEPFP